MTRHQAARLRAKVRKLIDAKADSTPEALRAYKLARKALNEYIQLLQRVEPPWVRVLKAALTLNNQQRELVAALIRGEAFQLTCAGELYACQRVSAGYELTSVERPNAEKRVVNDTVNACTCPRNKFQHERCKHLEALCSYLQS